MANVSLQALLIFTNQFSAMLSSQLPLVSVLKNLGDETPHRGLRLAIGDVREDVEHGTDFGDALSEHADIFDEIYVNIVRAGISSGKLGAAMTHLAAYLSNADSVRRKIRAATSYPMFMFMAFIVSFNGMVFFVLPRFEQMFANFGKDLPLATKILMAVGSFWREYWYVVVLALAIVIAGIFAWLMSPKGRLTWDEYKLKLPVFGRMWRMSALARFLRTLAVQIQNDVELLPSLRLSAPTTGNFFIEDIIVQIADDIEDGHGIADSFREYNVFSGIVLQMIASGEEAGELDSLMLSAADYFDRLLDDQIQTWTALINPILTVGIGLAIAGMMIGVFLPVFDMGKVVGGG